VTLTVGSLCSGIDGLALGVERALGTRTVWQSEIDPHGSTVLAHHWPGVPNHGDLRAFDWSQAEPVDLMCFGFPCQDISSAGRRAGLGGDSSALWFDCAAAVGVLRPRYVLVENVGALLVRGFGTVLADLAAMGYDARWGCLRSSDIGAPHRRERIFIAATHPGGERAGWNTGAPLGAQERPGRSEPHVGHRSVAGRAAATDACGSASGRQGGGPAVTDGRGEPSVGAAAYAEDQRLSGTGDARRRGHGSAHGGHAVASPDGERLEMWPELDRVQEPGLEASRRLDPDGRSGWGPYTVAIRRWEAIHRPAPRPRDDRGRLNPELPEWMLGFERGWVTGLDIPRTAQLRLIGNSCQPQVVELAARLLLAPMIQAKEAA
jgi:DNA (cytosine-5)-methyltransferase 1